LLLDGQPLAGIPPEKRPIHTVFQSYALFPHMTVAGNIAFPLEMAGRPPQVLGFLAAGAAMVAGSLLPRVVGHPSPAPLAHEHHAAALTHHGGEPVHRHPVER
ncbi:MAG TPA: hypothetical protein VFK74_02370, partial [Azospira sp.]|nr:hypothetical protein [Azospira sp.]